MHHYSEYGEKLDMRIRRTYNLLKTAFTQLLEERRYDDITVQELCTCAGIRRTTFYQHFGDKNEFVAWFLIDLQEQYLRRHPPSAFSGKSPTEFVCAATNSMLSFLKENEALITATQPSGARGGLPLKELCNAYIQELCRFLRDYHDSRDQLPLFPLDLVANYYIGAAAESVVWWYQGGKKYPQAQLLEDITSLTEYSPRYHLEHSLHIRS